MKHVSLIDRVMLSNPFYRGMVEWLFMIVTGICGWCFGWYKLGFFPYSNLLGAALMVVALRYHFRSEQHHTQAHVPTDRIDAVVTCGVYASIRHPLYLSLIVLNIGIALLCGVGLTYLLALLSVAHWTLTALREEAALLARFPEAYRHYQRMTKWRMIPGLF